MVNHEIPKMGKFVLVLALAFLVVALVCLALSPLLV